MPDIRPCERLAATSSGNGDGPRAVTGRSRSAVAAALAALLAFGTPGAPPWAADRASVNDTVESVLADERFQRDFPVEETPEPDEDGSTTDEDWLDRDVLADVAEVVEVLLYLLFGIAVIAIVVYLGRHYLNLDRWRDGTGGGVRRQSGDAEDSVTTGTAPGTGSLVRADALARAGRFADAVHLLLLGAFDDLGRRTDRPLDPALTSREVLARTELEAERRDALARIVGAAELSYFGGRPLGEADYGRCRDSFLALAAVREAA